MLTALRGCAPCRLFDFGGREEHQCNSVSIRSSESAKQRWSSVSANDRRAATERAVSTSVERRRRASALLHALEDSLEASGFVLVPADDIGVRS